MDFFPTLPPKVAKLLDNGRHHFVQAHHLLEHPIEMECSREQEWYRNYGAGPDSIVSGHWVTLDNGCWELGEPDVDALTEVARIIHPHEIVVPDGFRNKKVTLNWMRHYAHTCRMLAPCIMIVPQGENLLEWTQCARDMLAYLGSDSHTTLGIPKVVETYPGGRTAACEYLDYYSLVPAGGVHLLGIWYRIEEAIHISQMFPFVKSVDTTLPYACAMDGTYMYPSLYNGKVDMKEEWWRQAPDPEQMMLAAMNINICRRMVGGGGYRDR